MPELPEVETIARDLNAYLKEVIIKEVLIYDYRNFRIKDKTKIETIINNTAIKNIYRIGKGIIWELSNGNSIVFHLRMTGKFIINYENLPKEKHVMLIFITDKGQIAFVDIRKFATIDLIKSQEIYTNNYVKKLGLDPTKSSFTYESFLKTIKASQNKAAKQFLMEQNQISGIGNIYASEILFESKISPTRLIKTLSEKEISQLYNSIKYILIEAIQLRGTTFSDYRDGFNKKGEFQNKLKVYNKSNENCSCCGNNIKKIKQNGRSSYYCESCQK